jgi:hypothetical protein
VARGATSHEFNDISAVVSLGQKGLIVVDPITPEISWVSADLGVVRRIGREGRGPDEYLRPGPVFRLRADTVVVLDRSLRVFIVIHPEAGIVRKFPFPYPTFWGVPQGADTSGKLLFAIRSSRGGGLLVSTTLAEQRIDTLSTVAWADTMVVKVTEESTGSSHTMIVAAPFSAADAPVLFSNGQAAVLRVNPFRLDMFLPGGGVSEGATIHYRALAVTRADRELAQAEDVANRRPWAIGEYRFPPLKGPFVNMTAVPGRTGTVWVERHQPYGATRTVYDAITAAGVLRSCRFPARTRFLAFEDDETLLVAMADSDGLKRVARYRLTGRR